MIGSLVVFVGFVVYVVIETIYKLATGKIDKAEIERIQAADRRMKEHKQQQKAWKNLLDNLTHTSPLDAAMGRAGRSKTIHLDITIQKIK